MRNRPRLVLTASALVSGGFLAGCTTNQTTGRSQLNLLSQEQEAAMGDEAAPQLTQEFGGEVQNPQLQNYVTEVGRKLAAQTEDDGPQREWNFTLLDSPVINAFALPGEHVFISKGLADQMDNEAQLAGVLGHEIGHVMARHVGERISQSNAVGIGAQILGAIGGAVVDSPQIGQAIPALVTTGGNLVVLKFSRDQESEADELGMRYMAKAGYNPRGQLQVMQILERASEGAGGLEMLQTHPLPATRIQRVQQLLDSEYAYTAGNREYEFFEQRFQNRYLKISRSLPSRPQAQRGRMLQHVVLEDPTTWCAHCAAVAARSH